ncbi:replication protein RepA [Microbacterium foliorum]|uniref:replication protein RepA n=1 Tax=Rothia terrae TaxID=396015 RepID=UPI003425ED87
MPVLSEVWRELINTTKSPLALDIYIWLTYRLPSVRGEQYVSWEQLINQFGSQASEIHAFKKKFRPALKLAVQMYPGANVREMGSGSGRAKGFKGLVLRRSAAAAQPRKPS